MAVQGAATLLNAGPQTHYKQLHSQLLESQCVCDSFTLGLIRLKIKFSVVQRYEIIPNEIVVQ